MRVIDCQVPSGSLFDPGMVALAYFHDSYRTPMRRSDATLPEIFFAIFGHHPAWMKLALVVRNKIARACGLEAPSASEILNLEVRSSYVVGETIGVWLIYALTGSELVAGRDNKHLDFRLSVLKEEGSSVVVTTICKVHNWYGKVYLFFIVPFHRWGVRLLLTRALDAGRL